MAQLLSNLPVGAKVKFGKHQVNTETPWEISWLIVAKNHAGYPNNSVTLLAEKCINQLAFDGREPNNIDSNRQAYGNGRYSVSNIDQWLNSADRDWYTPMHSADAPPSADNIQSHVSSTAYDKRSGFLYHFTDNEREVILESRVRLALPTMDGGYSEDISRKVFLPSATEISNYNENNIAEGGQWEYFVKTPSTIAYLFPEAYNNAVTQHKPSSVTGALTWLLRTAYTTSGVGHTIRNYTEYGQLNYGYAYNGATGIRPALNLPNTLSISDTTDSDGCYTVLLNTAPLAPTILNVPITVYGGKTNVISWGNAIDPDGDALTYQLECSINGGSYTQIYSGQGITYTHLVPFGTSTVTYRVKATDPSGDSSAYTTSATLTVVNNYAPVISGSDSNLGVKSSGFTGTYKVTDANNNTVTVTESIDGVQIRSLVATLGADITYGVTGNTWLALPNGAHTLTIRATDGLDSTVRTYTFTKLANSFTIENSTPWTSSTMPSRIMLVITRNIPTGATFKIEVCNNGNDSSPTWEDATDAVQNGRVYVFTNKSKTSGIWGVKFRVTVNRNGATGACYVSAIGGNFE